MKKEVEAVVLTEAMYRHWYATTGFCGPCCAMQGAIDKACAKAGEVDGDACAHFCSCIFNI